MKLSFLHKVNLTAIGIIFFKNVKKRLLAQFIFREFETNMKKKAGSSGDRTHKFRVQGKHFTKLNYTP
jgi:hypothetical protein